MPGRNGPQHESGTRGNLTIVPNEAAITDDAQREIDHETSKVITFYIDSGKIQLLEGLILIDLTDLDDQIRAALNYALSNNPSTSELSSLSKSQLPEDGQTKVSVRIDLSTYEVLRGAGLTDEDIARIVSAACREYIDARLDDPDLGSMISDANMAHEALTEMQYYDEISGINHTDALVAKHIATGSSKKKAIIAAYKEHPDTGYTNASVTPINRNQ